jgi:hypothetical protein
VIIIALLPASDGLATPNKQQTIYYTSRKKWMVGDEAKVSVGMVEDERVCYI